MDDRPLPPYATDDRQRALRRNALRVMAIAGPLTVVNAIVAAFASSWLRDGLLDFLIGPWLPYVAALPALPLLVLSAAVILGGVMLVLTRVAPAGR